MGAEAVRLSNIDIDTALEEQDFEVLFQPIFDLGNGSLARMETFVRWRHQTLGLLPPGAFISFFETQGRMSELTRYVLHKALDAYVGWRGAFAPGFSINLALSDLADEAFANHLALVTRDRDFPAEYITLECPMPPVDAPIERMAESLARLSATGARLAIEVRGRANDFLRQVEPFPFDEIKTGGAAILQFARTVRGPGLSAISELLEIAKEHNAATTAVGVEDQTSLEALQKLGFAAAQGNHLGRVGVLESFLPSQVNDVRTMIGMKPLESNDLTALFRTSPNERVTHKSPQQNTVDEQELTGIASRRPSPLPTTDHQSNAGSETIGNAAEDASIDHDALAGRLNARIARETQKRNGDVDLDAAVARKAESVTRPKRVRRRAPNTKAKSAGQKTASEPASPNELQERLSQELDSLAQQPEKHGAVPIESARARIAAKRRPTKAQESEEDKEVNPLVHAENNQQDFSSNTDETTPETKMAENAADKALGVSEGHPHTNAVDTPTTGRIEKGVGRSKTPSGEFSSAPMEASTDLPEDTHMPENEDADTEQGLPSNGDANSEIAHGEPDEMDQADKDVLGTDVAAAEEPPAGAGPTTPHSPPAAMQPEIECELPQGELKLHIPNAVAHFRPGIRVLTPIPTLEEIAEAQTATSDYADLAASMEPSTVAALNKTTPQESSPPAGDPDSAYWPWPEPGEASVSSDNTAPPEEAPEINTSDAERNVELSNDIINEETELATSASVDGQTDTEQPEEITLDLPDNSESLDDTTVLAARLRATPPRRRQNFLTRKYKLPKVGPHFWPRSWRRAYRDWKEEQEEYAEFKREAAEELER